MEKFKRPVELPPQYLGVVSFDDTPQKIIISLDVKPLLKMRKKIKGNKEFNHLRSEIKGFVLMDLMIAWLIGWDESQYHYYFGRFATMLHVFQDIIKNILDHANYGIITLERGDNDGLPFINFSIGSFADANPDHVDRFFNALTLLTKEPSCESSRSGSGENFGMGTRLVLGQYPHAVVHIEKTLCKNYFWVKYSGWCTAPPNSKGK